MKLRGEGRGWMGGLCGSIPAGSDLQGWELQGWGCSSTLEPKPRAELRGYKNMDGMGTGSVLGIV